MAVDLNTGGGAHPSDDNTVSDPLIEFSGTIDDWEQLGITYASIGIQTYLKESGQSIDRLPFLAAMGEIKQIAFDILDGENDEDEPPA